MKPQDLFGNVVQFLASIIPGGVFTFGIFLMWHEYFTEIGKKLNVSNEKEIIISIVIICAYIFGHIIFQISSFIFQIFDWILMERYRNFTESQPIWPLKNIHYFDKYTNALKSRVHIIREKFEPNLRKKDINKRIDYWCEEFILVRNKDAAVDLAFVNASSKLFRSMFLVFFIFFILIAMSKNDIFGNLYFALSCVLLSIFCAFIYIRMRNRYQDRIYMCTIAVAEHADSRIGELFRSASGPINTVLPPSAP